jgi:hypothetical protein
MVAYMHAVEVPIAVPMSCRYLLLPNSKILFLTTISSACFSGSSGKPGGSFCWVPRLSSQRLMTKVAWLVSMLVYIDLASAVKNCAPVGSSPSWLRFSINC